MKKNDKEISSINQSVVHYNEKTTNTTLFLLPALGIPSDKLTSLGFVNAYYGDSEHDTHYKNSIYLLFKPKDNLELEEFIQTNQENILEDYNVGEHVMIVFKFPSDFMKEYRFFKQGKYSKFSKTYISLFPFIKKVEVDRKTEEKHTLFYHIFNKTDWIRTWWNNRLGYDKDYELEMDEWWDIPSDEKEIFRYKKD